MPTKTGSKDFGAQSKTLELSVGVAGILVGIVSIYLTVVTYPAALDAVGSALKGAGLPPAFKGLAGGLTLFCIVLVGVVALASLYIGLICIFSLLFAALKTKWPRSVAAGLVTFFFWLATVTTVVMFFDVQSVLISLGFWTIVCIGIGGGIFELLGEADA